MNKKLVPTGRIEQRIIVLRGQKVMFTSDVARLYEVEPGALIRAVKRNVECFPSGVMLRLTWADVARLRSQGVALGHDQNRKFARYAFTASGVALMSSVLRSERAVQVHIALIRTFVRLRATISSYRDLANRFHALEQKYDPKCKAVFDAIGDLMEPSV